MKQEQIQQAAEDHALKKVGRREENWTDVDRRDFEKIKGHFLAGAQYAGEWISVETFGTNYSVVKDALKELQRIEFFFRIENDEAGYYLSIIDRKKYPRVWADNYNDGATVIFESEESLLQRTTIGGKDWTARYFFETPDELLNKVFQMSLTISNQINKIVMTPEEKAKDIIKQCYHAITRAQQDKYFDIAMCKSSKEFLRAKACAIICVDTVLDVAKGSYDDEHINWWQSVKESINKM